MKNGSAGLGRIAQTEVVGEWVVVVWEFGRVGVFEVGTGRVTEVGECKTGIWGLRSAWGVRRGGRERSEGEFCFSASFFFSCALWLFRCELFCGS